MQIVSWLLSGKSKKYILSLSSAELALRVLKVNLPEFPVVFFYVFSAKGMATFFI